MPRIIDISCEVEHGTAVHEPYPGAVITHVLRPDDPGSYGRTSRQISAPLHCGTHVDAPEHMVAGSLQIQDYPLDTFFGSTLVVDMSHKIPRGTIGAEDLERAAGSKIRQGDRLLIRTGWPRLYGRAVFHPESPYLTIDGAEWIIAKGVSLVGTDFTIADPDDVESKCKQLLLRHRIPQLTNIENLDLITKERVTLIALPIKIAGVEAASTRAVVMEEE